MILGSKRSPKNADISAQLQNWNTRSRFCTRVGPGFGTVLAPSSRWKSETARFGVFKSALPPMVGE